MKQGPLRLALVLLALWLGSFCFRVVLMSRLLANTLLHNAPPSGGHHPHGKEEEEEDGERG